ncbi:MAG: hypothetical protein Q4F17_09275 [Eubacteriales bacterium]|nr:hypothetical protein [Eubacteriales bacterium]
MMNKFPYISAVKAQELILRANEVTSTKNGIASHAYIVDEYAVLKSSSIKLRNVITYDENLEFFDELINSLMKLHQQGVGVIPILGYCYDPDSHDGDGYIIEPAAKGRELYDDAIMKSLYIWGQSSDSFYLSTTEDSHKYLYSRITEISEIPQVHFDKFIHDIIAIYEQDILIDFFGRSNFFYDTEEGFQFIDLNSHIDYHYGLTKAKTSTDSFVATFGFTPCHYASNTAILQNIALHDDALSIFSSEEITQISECNRIVFEKCRNALLNNGISETRIDTVLQKLKIFGITG